MPTIEGCKQRTSPLASCRGRQALGFGECIGAEINCQDYNLITLECDFCIEGYEKMYTGLCEKKRQCGQRQLSLNGICINYPDNCVDVDGFGFCIDCLPGYDEVQGQCVARLVCPSGFYLNYKLPDPDCPTQY